MWLFFGTTFYSSLILKKGPGTVSSLAIFILFYFFNPSNIWINVGLVVVAGILHAISFPPFEREFKDEDPSVYTLDETIAIICLHIFFQSTEEWIAAFFLFRFFDILKPLGIKKIEKMPQIPSIVRNVADDVVAAFYTFILIFGYRYVG